MPVVAQKKFVLETCCGARMSNGVDGEQWGRGEQRKVYMRWPQSVVDVEARRFVKRHGERAGRNRERTRRREQKSWERGDERE